MEGAGKSTQAALLTQALTSRGARVTLTREPGGGALGEAVRRLVLDPAHAGMDPLAELYLVLAARAQHVAEVLAPALARGDLVISDRFYDATTAYQGGGRGLPEPLLAAVGQPAAGGLIPDVTFLLDLAPDAGAARRAGAVPDRLETEGGAFHRRVRDSYRAVARREPERVVLVDASGDRERIHGVILAETLQRLAKLSPPAPGMIGIVP